MNDVIDLPAEYAEEQQQEPTQALTVRSAMQSLDAPKATEAKPQSKTSQECRVVEVSEALLPAYQKASTLDLSDNEVELLMAPFSDEVVECRPHDGLLYIPHICVSDRLNRIFKPGKWALIRRREWFDGGTMFAEYVLVIRGCYVGESIGGHPFARNNPKINYSDVLESTAAEALRRICGKRLSCGSQVWNPEYCRTWEEKYRYQANGKYLKRRPEAQQTPQVAQKPVTPAATPPAAQNAPQPAPVRQDVPQGDIATGETYVPACTVVMVSERTGTTQKGKPWHAYFIKVNDGFGEIEVCTFSDSIGTTAKELAESKAQGELVYKPAQKAGKFEVVSLQKAEGEIIP